MAMKLFVLLSWQVNSVLKPFGLIMFGKFDGEIDTLRLVGISIQRRPPNLWGV